MDEHEYGCRGDGNADDKAEALQSRAATGCLCSTSVFWRCVHQKSTHYAIRSVVLTNPLKITSHERGCPEAALLAQHSIQSDQKSEDGSSDGNEGNAEIDALHILTISGSQDGSPKISPRLRAGMEVLRESCRSRPSKTGIG